MGLDMYLSAKTFISGYEHGKVDDRKAYSAVINAANLTAIADPTTPHTTVSTCVLYWRKANAIHNWFVNTVQNGVDDCSEYSVSFEQLQTLLDTVTQAIVAYKSDDIAKIKALMPPVGGFFFGGTDINDNFLYDMEATKTGLTRILKNAPEKVDFFYRSSW